MSSKHEEAQHAAKQRKRQKLLQRQIRYIKEDKWGSIGIFFNCYYPNEFVTLFEQSADPNKTLMDFATIYGKLMEKENPLGKKVNHVLGLKKLVLERLPNISTDLCIELHCLQKEKKRIRCRSTPSNNAISLEELIDRSCIAGVPTKMQHYKLCQIIFNYNYLHKDRGLYVYDIVKSALQFDNRAVDFDELKLKTDKLGLSELLYFSSLVERAVKRVREEEEAHSNEQVPKRQRIEPSPEAQKPTTNDTTLSQDLSVDAYSHARNNAKLVVESHTLPLFSDIKFILGQRHFCCVRAILCVQSSYFERLLTQWQSQEIDMSTISEVSWIVDYPEMFLTALRYLLSGMIIITEISQQEVGNWIALAAFARIIGDERLQQLALQTFKENVVEARRIADAGTLMMIIENLKSVQAQFATMYPEVFQSCQDDLLPKLQLQDLATMSYEDLVRITKLELQMALQQETSALPETKIFDLVIEWANYQALMKIPPGLASSHVAPAASIRNELNDILPRIQFEYMPLETLLRFEIGILTQQEVLDLVQAAANAAKGSGYTILGEFIATPRKKRIMITQSQLTTATTEASSSSSSSSSIPKEIDLNCEDDDEEEDFSEVPQQ